MLVCSKAVVTPSKTESSLPPSHKVAQGKVAVPKRFIGVRTDYNIAADVITHKRQRFANAGMKFSSYYMPSGVVRRPR